MTPAKAAICKGIMFSCHSAVCLSLRWDSIKKGRSTSVVAFAQ